MSQFLASLSLTLGALLPTILLAVVVLVVGWIIASVISGLVRKLLQRTSIDEKITGMLRGSESPRPEQVKVERWASTIVFWVVMFFVIVAALQLLNLTAISQPLGALLTPILAFIPGLISALILLIVAWIVASILRIIVTRVINASSFSRKMSETADVRPQARVTLGQTLGNVVYWLVFLLFLPAILSALNLQGILGPVQTMINNMLSYLPNILGAVLIFAIGYFVARIVRQIVTNLLAGVGVDRLTQRVGMQTTNQVRISDVIGWIAYVLILIPVAIAALNALNIPAVSTPASNMLNQLLTALPNIFAAAIVLVIAYFIGRLLGQFVATLLAGIGFDRLFASMGLFRSSGTVGRAAAHAYTETTGDVSGAATAQPASVTPSKIVGYIVTVAVILIAAMQAATLLGFGLLATLISSLIAGGAMILIGLIILGIGLYLASLADRFIRESGSTQANILAPVARAAIIIFSGALALREMGIADSIVNLAFGLLLGAVAVATAIAFGLGGRDFAHRQLERWQGQLDSQTMLPNTGGRPMDTPPGQNPGTGPIQPNNPDVNHPADFSGPDL